MFPLTETYKAVSESDSPVTAILTGICAVVTVVVFIIAIVYIVRDNRKK